MKIHYKRLFLIALLALAMPLVFMTGDAGAVYVGDGSMHNGTIGADGKVTNWNITDYGVCVTGIAADGTMSIDTSKKSRAACLTVLFPAYTTSAACTSFTNTEGSSHYWTNTCADASGNPISMEGFDRTAANCTDLGGTWTNRCTAAWVYTGPAGDGAPGFCYTTIDVTTAYSDAASCPTSTTGYSWTGSKCTYSYGIAGYANAAITKKDGSTVYASAGTFVDLSTLTQGQCLANGASWSTGTTKSGTTSVATTPTASVAANVTGSRAGCLECHNSNSQYNSYFGRWKESYLQTGHKNMLRKVTPGKYWAGPDGLPYTEAAGGQLLDFVTGNATGSYGTKALWYLFGDWMAPAPDGLDTVVDTGGGAARYNGTSNYSCAACHTTGWSNPSAGLCSQSSKTTQTACETAGGTWYPSNGVQGASYVPAEPLASFPVTSGIIGKWDRDGILCSRCHSVVFSPTSPAPAGTSTHHADGVAGANINNICFGCHQAIAKVNNNTGADNDLGNPAWNIPVKDADSGSAYVPEFNGHVLGNEFLNSPHARWKGPASGNAIVPNPLGKYDLVDAGNVANYGTQGFYGYSCRASATSASIYETYVKPDKTRGIIHDATTCAEAGGVWVADNETANVNANTGRSCATCHNVHESLFDPNANEPLRRECQTCHTTKTLGFHGDIAGDKAPKLCDTCHMPKATSGGFPMHLWRINTDPNYRTFPTETEFATKKNANTASETYNGGTYANAVWVDLDYACGQCHGGGSDPVANPPKTGIGYISKATLATFAQGYHAKAAGSSTKARISFAPDVTTPFQVNFDASRSICGATPCTYAWDFGDTGTSTSPNPSHVYAAAAVYNVKLTITDANGASDDLTIPVNALDINRPPAFNSAVTAGVAGTVATLTVDASSDTTKIYVDWKDGSAIQEFNVGDPISHDYATLGSGTYYVVVTIMDSSFESASQMVTVVIP